MMGPCLCGDTHCPSCGPAQGNWRCAICRAWVDDGCPHVEAICTGCNQAIIDGDEERHEQCGAHGHEIELRLRQEFQAEAEAIAAAERLSDDILQAQLEESERLWANQEPGEQEP